MNDGPATAILQEACSNPGIDRRLERVAAALRKRVFFIVGCQKSGTTWLQLLLNGHSAVCCRGEAYFGPVLAPALAQVAALYNDRQKIDDRGLEDDDVRVLQATAAGLLFERWIEEDPGDQIECVGEKTPEHAMCLPGLESLFPGMRVVHIIRDGRDVAVSGWFHNLRQKGDAFLERFPDMAAYIEFLIREHWRPYIAQARQFGALHPDRYHEIRYEDLHADPAARVSALLAFLGVEDGPAEIARRIEAGSFKRSAGGRKRGEENARSFFRKGVVGDWREQFDERALDAFMTHGGDLLAELGYE